MNFTFHPEAEAEFKSAIEYYEDCQRGLGYDFAIEVHTTVQQILVHPQAWPILENEVRRCLTRRFPFAILYSIEPDKVFILAVMHLHRDPDYWKER